MVQQVSWSLPQLCVGDTWASNLLEQADIGSTVLVMELSSDSQKIIWVACSEKRSQHKISSTLFKQGFWLGAGNCLKETQIQDFQSSLPNLITSPCLQPLGLLTCLAHNNTHSASATRNHFFALACSFSRSLEPCFLPSEGPAYLPELQGMPTIYIFLSHCPS